MNFSQEIAQHIRGVYFGGNWTSVNLKETLADLTWKEATSRLHNFNTIATLTFHLNYYAEALIRLLEGGELTSKDELSFSHAPITSQEEWERLVIESLQNGERFASLVEQLDEHRLREDFVDPRYGSYSSNLHGIIEHMHYHLGQMVILKRMIRDQATAG